MYAARFANLFYHHQKASCPAVQVQFRTLDKDIVNENFT